MAPRSSLPTTALLWMEAISVCVLTTFAGGALCQFRLVGRDAPLQALRMLTPESVPLAAGPERVVARLAMMALGQNQGLAFGTFLLWASGAAALWGLARSRGSDRITAAFAAACGWLSPPLLLAVQRGQLEFLAIPLVGWALCTSSFSQAAFATMLVGAGDARLALLTGIGAALLNGRWSLLFVGMVAGGLGESGSSDATRLDPTALLSPWTGPEALYGGLGLGIATFLLEPRWRRVALVGWVAALGPVARWEGEVLTVQHHALAMPGVLLSLMVPNANGWSAGLVLVAVAVALGWKRGMMPTVGLGMLLLVEAEQSWKPVAATLELPLSLQGVSTGKMLHLPLEYEEQNAAPVGSHALYRWWALQSGLQTIPGIAPMGATSPLYNEPLVILSLNLSLPEPRYLVPPTLAGDTLRSLGITDLVIHRSRFPSEALRILDPLLVRSFGPPLSDPEAQIQIYHLPPGEPHAIDDVQLLRFPGETNSSDWHSQTGWLLSQNQNRSLHE